MVASALEWTPGIAIVNSVHLERGWERVEKIFPLLKQYGAVTVAMTIDEQGMALTRQGHDIESPALTQAGGQRREHLRVGDDEQSGGHGSGRSSLSGCSEAYSNVGGG